MGRGGFEPPKQVAADLQSVPFGHSGIYPDAMKIFYMYFRLTAKKYIISSNHTQDFFLLVLDFLVSIKICINNFSFWFSKTLLPLYFVICIFGHLYIYIVLLKFCIMYCPAHVQTFCIYLFYVEFLTMHIPLHISYFTYPIVKYFQNVRLGCWAKAVNNILHKTQIIDSLSPASQSHSQNIFTQNKKDSLSFCCLFRRRYFYYGV